MRTGGFLLGLLFALGAAGCGAARAWPDPPVGNLALELGRRVSDSELVHILNDATVAELNYLEGGEEQDLSLRLYRLPVSGSCVPETHVTCAFDYYLAVSEFDEQPRQSVFHLGVVGEIVDIAWQALSEPDRATLQLKVLNYPADVLERNQKLQRTARAYSLKIHVDGIEKVTSDR